jgi:hypothetical protein
MIKPGLATFPILLLVAMPAAAVPPTSVTDMRNPAIRAAYCAAYLSLDLRVAPGTARPRSTAALRAWRAELLRLSGGDAGRAYQSAQDATNNDSVDTRRDAAAYCESRAPTRGRRR